MGPGKTGGQGTLSPTVGDEGKKDTLVNDLCAASKVKEALFFYFWRLSGIPVPPRGRTSG